MDSYTKYLPYLPIVILIFLPILFFSRAAIGESVIVSGDLSGSDLLDLQYPFKVAIHDAVTSGTAPLWSPYLDGGYPLFAEGQMGFFYPVNILLSPLPAYLALNWSIILSFIIAGLSAYLYCRTVNFSRFASLVAAITFSFSSFFVTRSKHINIIAVSSLFPLGLYWIELYWRRKNIVYLGGMGVTLGLQILAGHPQMAFYCLLGYLWVFFYRLARRMHMEKSFPLGQAITGLVISGVIAVALGAVQILPTVEMTMLSSRPGYSMGQISMYPYNPKNLITLFSPYFFGNPATGSYKQDIRSMGIFWENASYVGLLPLILAFVCIFDLVRKNKSLTSFSKYLSLFFLLTAVISLALMMGQYTPLFPVLAKNIPLVSLFRFPTRFNLLLVFSLAVMAGLGAGRIIESIRRIGSRGRFHWPLSIQRTQIVIMVIIVIDLFTIGQDFIGYIKASQWLAKPESVKFLDSDPGMFRIWSLSQYNDSPYQAMGWKTNTKVLLAIREAIPPNANINWKIPTISDRSWFEGGLPVLRHYQFENWLMSGINDEYMMGKVLGMFNVKYLLTYFDTQNSELPIAKEINLGPDFGMTLKLYENKQVMDRAFFVPEYKTARDAQDVLKIMGSYDYLPTRSVILEKDPGVKIEPFNSAMAGFEKDNQVTIENYAPSQVIIKANLKNKGFLVLSDTPYPGWKAEIDGKQSEILTANFLQRAMYMEPGNHTVRFWFDPLSFKVGKLLTGITLGIILCFGAIEIIKGLRHHRIT